MKYQVIVTREKYPNGDDTIFQQSFEELDVKALAIFLNTPNLDQAKRETVTVGSPSMDIPFTDQGYTEGDGTSPVTIKSNSPFGPGGTVAEHGFQKTEEVAP